MRRRKQQNDSKTSILKLSGVFKPGNNNENRGTDEDDYDANQDSTLKLTNVDEINDVTKRVKSPFTYQVVDQLSPK